MTPTYTHILLARGFAEKFHKGQTYGLFPFLKHIEDVFKISLSLNYHEPITLIVCILHDIIEDTEATFAEIKKHFGNEVALAVLALTNIGKKANYTDLQCNETALLVKLFDRLANITQSILEGNPKGFKYVLQHDNFRNELYRPEHHLIWEVLDHKIEMFNDIYSNVKIERKAS